MKWILWSSEVTHRAAATALMVGWMGWGGGQAAERGAEPATGTALEARFEIPKSVFVLDREKGRDPFFPKSTRWSPKETVKPDALPLDVLIERQVRLVGITGPEGNRVALINNQNFKVGDTAEVRLTDRQRVAVTLLRILERSVAFRVEGSDREYEKALAD
jgi:hypothetical protein